MKICSKALHSVHFVTMASPGTWSSHTIGDSHKLSTTSSEDYSFQNILFQQALDQAMAEQTSKQSKAAPIGHEPPPGPRHVSSGNHNSTLPSSPIASAQTTSPPAMHFEVAHAWGERCFRETIASEFIFPVSKLPKSRKKNPRKRNSDATEVSTAREHNTSPAGGTGLTNPFKQRFRANLTHIPTLAEFRAAQRRSKSENADPMLTSQAHRGSPPHEAHYSEGGLRVLTRRHTVIGNLMQVSDDLDDLGSDVAMSTSAAISQSPPSYTELSPPFDVGPMASLGHYETEKDGSKAHCTPPMLVAGPSDALGTSEPPSGH